MSSARYVFDETTDGKPGTYSIRDYSPLPMASGRHVRAFCPDCGMELDLSRNRILPGGVVSPAAMCSRECGFSELITLGGWGAPDGEAENE